MVDLDNYFKYLIEQANESEFKGIDPYDFASSKIKLPHAILSKVSFLNKISPINFRPILGIKETENTKSNALFLNSLVLTDAKNYNEEIELLFTGLIRNKSLEFTEYSLGFAFEMALKRYNSGPGKTSLIISLFAMFAFFDYYKVDKNEKILELIKSFEILLDKTWMKFEDDTSLWYSYLHDKKDEVYNATAKVGRFYALYYEIYPSKPIKIKLGKILNYLESVQSNDGSWGYSVKNPYVDNFHTAFILESIHQIHNIVKTQASENMFNKGLGDYIENCFKGDTPLHFHVKHYPRDIRSKIIKTEVRDIANAIILFSKIGMVEKAEAILKVAFKTFYDEPNRYFYFFENSLFMSRINFIRWQAWMSLAIAIYSNNKSSSKLKNDVVTNNLV